MITVRLPTGKVISLIQFVNGIDPDKKKEKKKPTNGRKNNRGRRKKVTT